MPDYGWWLLACVGCFVSGAVVEWWIAREDRLQDEERWRLKKQCADERAEALDRREAAIRERESVLKGV